MNRQTIVFVESANRIGGVEFSTLYLVQHLDRSKWKPCLIYPEEGLMSEFCRQSDIPAYILKCPRLLSSSLQFKNDLRLPNPLAWIYDIGVILIASKKLSRFLKRVKPDLIITKGLFAHFYGGFTAWELNIPCIWHLQDFISERFMGLYKHIFGLMASRIPDHIIVDGSSIAHQLPYAVQDSVKVILNGVDTNIFHPGIDGQKIRAEFGIPHDFSVIGSAARLAPWKGQLYLIEAFRTIANDFPKALLMIVGGPAYNNDSYEHALHQRMNELKLTNRVIFTGYRTDLAQVMAAMDIFVYTSVEKDTSPLALLSAMAMGLSIVAFDIEGVREILGEPEAGYLVKVGQREALERGISRMLNEPELRFKLSKTARSQVEKEFSLDKYKSSMENIFTLMLNTNLPKTVVSNKPFN
ncbi:glycosyltransferase family 4 protein [Desulfococcaceae bacterium HSG9]|nr:glycosyltransferase family 4 protein [Desulfococcaceae bacterium HSG9]